MTFNGWLQILVFFATITVLTRPLGGYMHRVFNGSARLFKPLRPIENGIYRLAGIAHNSEQHWTAYALSVLMFNMLGFVLLYVILLTQAWLPLNSQQLPNLTADLAFNTAISFVTNTNWQSYAGESTMSDFSQMVGLTLQNFLSAATGIAVAIAVCRGFARRSTNTLGNFWVDMTRCTLYVLLPLSIVFAVFLIWQGAPQNFHGAVTLTTLEGAQQTIINGPVASQEAIKMLGSNGGGFFNVNSAHPFENPNAVTGFVECLTILLLAAALTNTFGRMVGDELQGWALYSVMAVLFLTAASICYWAETQPRADLIALNVDQTASAAQPGGNMEGKEARFGIADSTLWTTATTSASNGSINSAIDSYSPIGGLVAVSNILLGEIIFGGVGSGLYGMLLYAVMAVFLAGLMVGRTPEYLGKKIESKEIKMIMLAFLSLPLAGLPFLAVAAVTQQGLSALANSGPHGFSEMMYAYSSAIGNNGSAFAGLSANAPNYNITLGISMLIGRFAIVVPVLAMAGSLAAKRSTPASNGTFPTKGALFIALMVGVIIVVAGLTYFPMLALGPIVEQFSMLAGKHY